MTSSAGVAASNFFQFTAGNLLTILLIAGLVVGGYYRLRGVKNEELAKTADFWRQQCEAMGETLDEYRTRNTDLERERDNQRSLKHEALNDLHAERLKTDLSGVLKQLAASHTAVIERLSDVEEKVSTQLAQMTETQETMVETLQGMLGAISTLAKR